MRMVCARLLAVWLGLAALVPPAAAQEVSVTSYRVRVVDVEQDPGGRLLHFAMRCERGLQNLLDQAPPATAIQVFCRPLPPRLMGNLIQVGLDPAEQSSGEPATLVRAILWRRFLEARPEREFTAGQVPDWLVTAMWLYTRREPGGAFVGVPYSSYRLSLEAGRQPQLAAIADRPVPPAFASLHELYAENCLGLLRLLLAEDRAFLVRLFAASDPAASPSQNLLTAMCQPRRFAPDPQTWFARELPRLVFRFDQPWSHERVKAKLEEALRVTVLLPDELGRPGARQVPVLEVAAVLRDYRCNALALDRKIAAIMVLQQSCPLLLRDPLGEYVEALTLIRGGNRLDGEVRFAYAQDSFAAAWQRSQAIQDHLLQVELERGRLRPPVREVLDAAPFEFEGRLNAWLDTLERPGGRPR